MEDPERDPKKKARDKSPATRVRARTHIAEVVDGELRRFEPGAEFTVPRFRAEALGALVEILK